MTLELSLHTKSNKYRSINKVKQAYVCGDDDVGEGQLRFTYLFRGPVTLSTLTHRHYNESCRWN